MIGRLAAALGRGMGWGSGGLDAGQSERRLKGFVAARQHVNTLVQASGSTVLARARYLARNNGYAANAVQCFASAAVGYGIKPAGALAARQKAWSSWVDRADHEGVSDFYGIQYRAATELFIAGECFALRRIAAGEDGAPELRIQLLPAEMLDQTYTMTADPAAVIRQGIEFDIAGHRVAYHFWREHPGDATEPASGERVRIPARDVIHVFDPAEAGQLRGLPRLTPAIVKLWLLDVYDDAELDRKKTAAMFAAFITRPVTDDGSPLTAVTAARDDPSVGVTGLEPGTMQFLEPGEEMTFSTPADVGGSYEPFQYRTLVQVCAALGLPYAGVTGDVLKANYSNMRAALIEARRRMDRLQHGILVFQLCRTVWRWWTEVDILAGRLAAPGYASDPSRWLQAKWIPPRNDWIDPYKDRQAELLAVRAGFTTLERVIEAEGYDLAETLSDIARVNRTLDELGLVLDSDPRKVNRAGVTQAVPEGSMLPDPVIDDAGGPGQEAA